MALFRHVARSPHHAFTNSNGNNYLGTTMRRYGLNLGVDLDADGEEDAAMSVHAPRPLPHRFACCLHDLTVP